MLAALLELAPGGVEQVDGEGFVEYAVYGAPGELPVAAGGRGGGRRRPGRRPREEVPDDWDERWKRFHAPVLVGGRLYVRPPWEEPAVRPACDEVVIDPGPAFGTGAHPTTRHVPRAAARARADGGLAVADLGCGSGVLAIAAAKLGFAPVTALDSDRDAVDATVANARANDVELAAVERANLREQPPPPADVLVANLMRPLLLRVAELIGDPPRSLIVSGLLAEEAGEVAEAFGGRGLVERRRLTDAGWSALLLGAG